MTDQTGAPGETPAVEPARECPWCAAPAAPGATHCTQCGAALAQRESIGDVRIPGLTSVDPALLDFDKRPLHIHGASPTHSLAPTLIVGALAGGPVGLVAMGGVAALAGVEFVASQHDGTDERELADVGKPSEVLLQALEHEREATAAQAGTSGTSSGGTPAGGTPAEPPAGTPAEPDAEPGAAAADHGMSIWRDLPPEHDAGG